MIQLDEKAVIERAAELVAAHITSNRSLLTELAAAWDRSGTVAHMRANTDQLIRDAVELAKQRIAQQVEAWAGDGFRAEMSRHIADIKTKALRVLETAADEVVRAARKDMGKTLRRAIMDALRTDFDEKLGKIFRETSEGG